MTKKKDTGDHVTLTADTLKKLLKPKSEPTRTFIDPWDILAMERADMQVKQCQLQQAKARIQALEIEAARSQAEFADIALKSAVKDAMREAQELAANVAKRYAFDWGTHAYNPETGELIRSVDSEGNPT